MRKTLTLALLAFAAPVGAAELTIPTAGAATVGVVQCGLENLNEALDVFERWSLGKIRESKAKSAIAQEIVSKEIKLANAIMMARTKAGCPKSKAQKEEFAFQYRWMKTELNLMSIR